jgi:hypothetical protein
MTDELEWNFADPDEAKTEIRDLLPAGLNRRASCK